MAQREIHANEGQYTTLVSNFKNTNQLEQQLTNLLLSAYDQKWLAIIMDPIKGQNNKQLPLIFYLLYTNYGKITPTALNQKRDACTKLIYNPSDYDLVVPATPYICPVHPVDPPTFDIMTQRKIHANEGQYIARVSDLKNIN